MDIGADKSLYLQIEEFIENNILRAVFLEEEQVPSTNELAKMFSINPATAAKGINLLVDEGILYKKRGIGMFVAKGAKEKIVNIRKNKFYETYILTAANEAAALNISREELILMLNKALDAGK